MPSAAHHQPDHRELQQGFTRRSSWMPESSALTVSEKRSIFVTPLNNKGIKEERMTKVRADDLDTSTPLESNKNPGRLWGPVQLRLERAGQSSR